MDSTSPVIENVSHEASLKLPSLEEVLRYKNKQIVSRFANETGLSKSESEFLFENILKYLWLQQKQKFDKNGILIFMYPEMDDMDHMWHNFILFTREYIEFSNTYFGGYMHHRPCLPPEPEEQGSAKDCSLNGEGDTSGHACKKNDEPDVLGQFNPKGFARYYKYVYDNLGLETASFWFNTPAEKIAALDSNLSPEQKREAAFTIACEDLFGLPVTEEVLLAFRQG